MRIQDLEKQILVETFQTYDDVDEKIENPPTVRKKRLKLKHLNRIRKLRQIYKTEFLKELEINSFLYGQKPKS